MKRIAAILLIAGLAMLSLDCGPSMQSIIRGKIPELKMLYIGTYDLGEFKNGESTPYRMMPAANGERRSITFTTVPESRRFTIVLDDGRVFKFDEDSDLAELAGVHLHEQSFYIEFRQDMRMIVVVSQPPLQVGTR